MAAVDEELEEFGIETAKNTSLYVGAQLASSLISFAVLIIAARVLGPSDFGIFIIAVSFATLLGFGGNLSFGAALRKMLPAAAGDTKRIRSLLGNAFFFGSLTGLVITLIAFALSGAIAVYVYHDALLSLPLGIASIMIVLTVLFNVGLSSLVGIGRIKQAAISDLLYSTTQLAAVSILIYLGYGIPGAVAGMVFGFFAGLAAEILYLRKAIGGITTTISRKVIGQMLDFSMPVFVSQISSMGFTNFAVLLLGVFVASSIVGNYGAALKLGVAFQVITASTSFIMLFSFSKVLQAKTRLSRHIKSIYASTVYYSFLFVLPMLAYLVSSARPFSYLFFSSAYTLTPAYFTVIAIGVTIDALEVYAGNLMLAYGRPRVYMRYQLAAIAICLVLMLALTPYLGVAGVLFPLFVVSPVLLGVVYCITLSRDFELTLHYRKLSALAIAALATAALAILLHLVLNYGGHVELVVNLLLVLLVYPPLAVLFRGIEENNIGFLRKFAQRLGPVSPLLRAVLSYTAFFVR
jgi:O-antigen/teichoic acid export membrane protein